jgi:hypothetical protein
MSLQDDCRIVRAKGAGQAVLSHFTAPSSYIYRRMGMSPMAF